MKEVNIGIIGLGRFGQFLLSAYSKMKEARVFAISTRNEEKLIELAKEFKIKHYFTNYKDMLKLKELDVVIISTPPYLHAKIAIEAIKSKKHVICEKPIATNIKDANKIKDALRKSNTLFSVNYVLRKNPINLVVKKIIEEGFLGNLQALTFENFASDSHLGRKHWFWDKKKSGGIWVEHGVHFFDIFEVLTNQKIKDFKAVCNCRNKKIKDEVAALCLYNKGMIASIIHSFTMPGDIEKCITKFCFDKGYIRVIGWIPERVEIEGVLNEKQYKKLYGLFSRNIFKVLERKSEKVKDIVMGRAGDLYEISRNIRFVFHTIKSRDDVYQDSIREIMKDFIKGIHKKKKIEIDFNVGYESLKTSLFVDKGTRLWRK